MSLKCSILVHVNFILKNVINTLTDLDKNKLSNLNEKINDNLKKIETTLKYIGRNIYLNDQLVAYELINHFFIGRIFFDIESENIICTNNDPESSAALSKNYIEITLIGRFNFSFLTIKASIKSLSNNSYKSHPDIILYQYPLYPLEA